MTTGSTKSRRNSRRSQPAGVAGRKRQEPSEPPRAAELSNRAWLIAAGSIFAVGAWLRLYDLSMVPLHHDEGVNGNFLVRLVRDGFYQYDPGNYHGPTLYYFSAIIPWTMRYLFGTDAQNAYGLTTYNIRLVPALFSLERSGYVIAASPAGNHQRIGGAPCSPSHRARFICPDISYTSRYLSSLPLES